MKKKQELGINLGSSSILMIFVLLCLVSFATLSIVSANADNKLSAKVLNRTSAYYNACNTIESVLAMTDEDLAAAFTKCDNADAYYQTVGHTQTFTAPISDLQHLEVTIDIQYPEKAEDTFYRITSWQIVTDDASGTVIIE